MNPAKYPLVFLIILALMLSIGCGGDGGGGDPLADPHHGSAGLAMSFHPDSPPDTIDSGRSFKIIVQASNEGASDIVDGTVTLTNLISEEVSIQGSTTKTITLYGRSRYVSAGQRTSLIWSAKAIGDKKGDIESKVGVSAQYRYQTNATSGLCIDPYRDTDTSATTNDVKSCEMQKTLSLGDQGGPVAVSSLDLGIDQEAREVLITATVADVGGGEVVGDASGSGINQVSAKATLGGAPLECDSAVITLDKGQGQLMCHGRYTSDTAYTTSLHIQLDYTYRQNLPAVAILIKKAKA